MVHWANKLHQEHLLMTKDNLAFYCLMNTSWSPRLSPSEPDVTSTRFSPSTPFQLFLNCSHSSSPSYVCIWDDRFIEVCWSALERGLLLRLIIPTSSAEDHTLCWQPSVFRIQPQLAKQMFVFWIVCCPPFFFSVLLSSVDSPCSSQFLLLQLMTSLLKCTLKTWKLAMFWIHRIIFTFI